MSLSVDVEGPQWCMLALDPLASLNGCTHLLLLRMVGHIHIMTHVALYGTPVHCSLAKLLFSHMNVLPHHGFTFSNKAANTVIVCALLCISPISWCNICKYIPDSFKFMYSVSWIDTFLAKKVKKKKVKVKQFLYSPGQALRVPGS